MFLKVILSLSLVCFGLSYSHENEEQNLTGPVHLVLRNINFLKNNNNSGKDFDVVDFSLYLPRIKATVSDRIDPSNLLYGRPKLRNNDIKHLEGYTTSRTPYFEALTGLIPKTTNSTRSTLLKAKPFPPSESQGIAPITSFSYFLPTESASPHFEALTAPKNLLKSSHYDTRTVHHLPIYNQQYSNYSQNPSDKLVQGFVPKRILMDNFVYHENDFSVYSVTTEQEPGNDRNKEHRLVEKTDRRKHPIYYKKESSATESPLIQPHKSPISDSQNDEARYSQDIYVGQNSPHVIEFGHIMENPSGWEERFERQNTKDQRHQGKVRWSDKNGGYGEHYWDLGHSKKK